MFTNISKREKLLAGITIGAASIALAYNFVAEPLAKRWRGLDKEISEKEAVFARHTRVLGNKERIEKLHSEYSKYVRTEKLSPEEESAIALGNIEKFARGSGVMITNFKPLTAKRFETYNKLTFRVVTESRIGELAKFIYNLQNSEQLLKVERMVLRAKERSPDTIKAILHITKISVF